MSDEPMTRPATAGRVAIGEDCTPRPFSEIEDQAAVCIERGYSARLSQCYMLKISMDTRMDAPVAAGNNGAIRELAEDGRIMSEISPSAVRRETPRDMPESLFENGAGGFWCRYRVNLAGFYVCSAAGAAAVVTDTDCGVCPVPETVAQASCVLLQPKVRLAPRPQAEWICGATEDGVDPHASSGCCGCQSTDSSPVEDPPSRPTTD